jgi:hypothetical protein
MMSVLDHPDQPVIDYRRRERPQCPPLTAEERRWRLYRYALITGLLLYAAFIAFYIGPHEILFGKTTTLSPADFVPVVEQQGIPFLRAVLAYQRDHGTLPANHRDLIPAYLPDSPTTARGFVDRGHINILTIWNHGLTYDLTSPHPQWRVHGPFANGIIPLPSTVVTPTTAPATATGPSAPTL